jgi:hypothetical protein
MDMTQDPRFAAAAELEGERATLLDYLRNDRLTMEMKCADLDAAQLALRSVPPSTMSLLGSSGTWPMWSATGSGR